MTVYADPRDFLFELIDGMAVDGTTVSAFYRLPGDYTTPDPARASTLIYATGGTEGAIDRVDRVTVEVYAPGTTAVRVAEAVRARLVNDGYPHDLEAGLVDEIRCDVTPHDVPFVAETVNQANAVYLVEHRPL